MRNDQHNFRDVRRLGFVPVRCNFDAVTIPGGILAAVTCYGIFGSGDKVQSTVNTQTGASEDAVQGTGGSAVSREGSAISTQGSNSATVATDGSVAVSNNSSLQTGGVKLGGNNSGSIVVGYDAPTFNSALTTIGNNFTSALNTQSSVGKSTLDGILNSLSGLAESKQTQGESGRNNIVLWVVVGLLVLLGWMNRK